MDVHLPMGPPALVLNECELHLVLVEETPDGSLVEPVEVLELVALLEQVAGDPRQQVAGDPRLPWQVPPGAAPLLGELGHLEVI